MKNLRAPVLCACFALISVCSFAQQQKAPINEPDYNKPHLFDNLPAKISFNPETFTSLTGKQAGNVVSISLSDKVSIPFEGKMLSSVTKDNGRVQSIAIQSTNYNGATFYMSKVTGDDGTVRYNGRIISFTHGDLYILQKTNNQYELVKKNFYDLVNE